MNQTVAAGGMAGQPGSTPGGALPPEVAKMIAAGKRGDGGGPVDIVDTDDRQRQVDPKIAPFRMICSIEVSFGSAPPEPIGTGWLVGRRTVVTAGHVLWWTQKAVQVRVIPGRKGRPDTADALTSSDFHFHPLWSGQAGERPERDIAAIRLPEPIGEKIGWFGVQAMSEADLLDRFINIAGYPATVTNQTVDRCTEMWFMVNTLAQARDGRLFYANDTSEGQSGAPVMLWTDAGDGNLQPVVAGVHSRGFEENGKLNSGTWIDAQAIALLGGWVTQDNALG